MGARGPAGLPSDVLKRNGSYRDAQHSVRGARPEAEGVIEVPEGIEEPGRSLFFKIVDFLQANGIGGEVDSAAVEQCCRLYNLLQRAHENAAETDIESKEARLAVTGYYASWVTSCSKLGITPLDRYRLTVGDDKGANDEDRDLLGD